MTEQPSGPERRSHASPHFDAAHPSVVARLLAAEEEFTATGPAHLGQADCCSAEAHYRAVLPASEQRLHRAQLMLCGHHARVCREKLVRSGAEIYDEWGVRV